MSLRAAILLLLFANLAFFGWAHLVDVAPEPPRSDNIEHLPKLKLLSEVQNHPAAQRSSPKLPRSNTAPSSPASAGGDPPTGATVNIPADSQASAGTAAAVARSPVSPASAQRCVTVGPFGDPTRVDQAANLLQQRGFEAHERTEQSPEEGYWVYVGGLKSDSDAAAVIQRLAQNGVADAHAMPESDKGRRVSVGFFTERDGAERRARTVKTLGLNADIEKRTQSTAAHWVDVYIDSSGQSLPAEGLLSLEEVGSRLEIKECPPDEKAGGEDALAAKTVAEAQPAKGPNTPASSR